MNALWFSKHRPTDEQLTVIHTLGYKIVAQRKGIQLSSRSLEPDTLIKEIRHLAARNNAVTCFGTFTEPVLERWDRTNIKCFPVRETRST